MKLPLVVASALLLPGLTAQAVAHHSYNAFNMAKTVALVGTVKEFHWTNPHSWILLEIVDAAGTRQAVSIESNGPGYLVRYGWKRESLRPGDKITARMHPLRDGSSGGSLVSVVLPDGRELHAEGLPPGHNGNVAGR
jgi:hypothetical protein